MYIYICRNDKNHHYHQCVRFVDRFAEHTVLALELLVQRVDGFFGKLLFFLVGGRAAVVVLDLAAAVTATIALVAAHIATYAPPVQEQEFSDQRFHGCDSRLDNIIEETRKKYETVI